MDGTRIPDYRATRRMTTDHHRSAEQHHRVEDRGVHVHRQALDEGLGEERAGKGDDPDQQRERDHLRGR